MMVEDICVSFFWARHVILTTSICCTTGKEESCNRKVTFSSVDSIRICSIGMCVLSLVRDLR